MHRIKIDDESIRFSAAHFVIGENYCESLHGHNYQVSANIEGGLDEHGMVLDFRSVKKQIRKICSNLDHRVLLPAASHRISVHSENDEMHVTVANKRYVFPSEDCRVLPINATTAELLAEYIASQIDLPSKYHVEICVSESAGSSGCYKMRSS